MMYGTLMIIQLPRWTENQYWMENPHAKLQFDMASNGRHLQPFVTLRGIDGFSWLTKPHAPLPVIGNHVQIVAERSTRAHTHGVYTKLHTECDMGFVS